MRRSVAMHSSGIAIPKKFTVEQVRAGFNEFHAMCAGCHGAPEKTRGAVGNGLRPQPPDLARAVPKWKNANLFWIVKNGIKMTGMPAFGPTHDTMKRFGTSWRFFADSPISNRSSTRKWRNIIQDQSIRMRTPMNTKSAR